MGRGGGSRQNKNSRGMEEAYLVAFPSPPLPSSDMAIGWVDNCLRVLKVPLQTGFEHLHPWSWKLIANGMQSIVLKAMPANIRQCLENYSIQVVLHLISYVMARNRKNNWADLPIMEPFGSAIHPPTPADREEFPPDHRQVSSRLPSFSCSYPGSLNRPKTQTILIRMSQKSSKKRLGTL